MMFKSISWRDFLGNIVNPSLRQRFFYANEILYNKLIMFIVYILTLILLNIIRK